MVSDENLDRAVERFGQALEQAGLPRMPARLFAYALAEDRTSYTARDLAEGLQISAGAVSGATRYLVDTQMLAKGRQPGGRGHTFEVNDHDFWARILRARLPMMDGMIAAVRDAAALLDEGSPGQVRLQETVDFFEFYRQDLNGILDRWETFRAERAQRRG